MGGADGEVFVAFMDGANSQPPSPGPLPPILGEGEFESPSPRVGRGI